MSEHPLIAMLKTAAPIKNKALRIETIKRFGLCPECGDELDTGGECNGCDFDSRKEWERQLP